MALRSPRIVVLASLAALLAGCSSFGDTNTITTASLPEPAKVDPACAGLTTQIASLRQEGVGDKIANAAAKKYKMTAADLAKADQLTKANADFQAKCVPGVKAPQEAMVAPVVPKVAAGTVPPVQVQPKPAALTKTQ